MRKTFDALLAVLASSLHDQGFIRQGHSFSRNHSNFVEHFVFQPDTHNAKGFRHRYYLNVGLEFPRLYPAAKWAYQREPAMVSWLGDRRVSLSYVCPEAVWGTRANALVPSLAKHWELTPDSDLAALEQDIRGAILACSEELPAWAKGLQARVRKAQVLGVLAWPFIQHKLKRR